MLLLNLPVVYGLALYCGYEELYIRLKGSKLEKLKMKILLIWFSGIKLSKVTAVRKKISETIMVSTTAAELKKNLTKLEKHLSLQIGENYMRRSRFYIAMCILAFVQELIKKQTKRRPPKAGNGEKNMFTGLLFCADCGSKMWYHVRHNKETTYFFSCSNYKGDRGTCESTHYIRADSVEMIVRAELEKLAQIVTLNENAFANLLEEKVNKDIVKEQKLIEQSIAKATARSQEVSRLYERVYEDNVNGKVTDAWFMELSHKYEVERDELKKKILDLNQQLAKISEIRDGKEHFLSCVRSFAEMNEVTPMILQELIEKIEVYAVEGTGLNRTQSVVIHYKFIGELDMPENFDKIKVNTRKGVEVEYLRTTKTA